MTAKRSTPARRVARPLGCITVLAAALLASLSVAGAEETLEERRQRVEQMDPQEREQLSQNYERFRYLDPAERERLRRLHDDLETAPDRDELRAVMQHYHEWLNELPAGQRMMLAALSPEDRLKRIDEIRAAQHQVHKLSTEDRQAIREWARQRDIMGRWSEARQKNTEVVLSPEDLRTLREALSEPAQQAFDRAQGTEQWRRIMRSWAGQAFYQGGPGGSRGGGRWPSAEDLQKFQRDHLTDEERARMLLLQPEQMQRELLHLWREHHSKDGDERRHPPGGKGPDGPSRRGRPAGEKKPHSATTEPAPAS